MKWYRLAAGQGDEASILALGYLDPMNAIDPLNAMGSVQPTTQSESTEGASDKATGEAARVTIR